MADDFYGYQSQLDYIAQEEEETKRKEEEAERLIEEHRAEKQAREAEKAENLEKEKAIREEEEASGTLDQPDDISEDKKKELIPTPTEEEFEAKEKEQYDYEKEMEEHKKELTDYKKRLQENKKDVFEEIARKVKEEKEEIERKRKDVPTISKAYKETKTPEEADNLIDKTANEPDIKKRNKLQKIALQQKIDNNAFDRKESVKEKKLKLAEKSLQKEKREEIEKELMPYYKKITKQARGANSDNARLKRIMKVTEEGSDTSSAKATLAESVGDAIGVDLSGLIDVDALELRTLSVEFMRNIKATLGTAQITNTEVGMYMSTVPNLMQSPEGRLRVAQNNLILNYANILKKNAMDKIIEDNNDIIPEDLERRVEEMTKSRKAILSQMFTNGMEDATNDASFVPIDPERMEKLVTIKPEQPEVKREAPQEYIERRKKDLRRMSEKEAQEKGFGLQKEVARQSDEKKISLGRINKQIKTTKDLDKFTAAIKHLPEMDKQETRDKVASFVMQKKFEILKKKEIKERNDSIEEEFKKAEKSRLKIKYIEEDREYSEEKMADKISEKTGIKDPEELKKLSKNLLNKKVATLKKEVQSAIEKKMGITKDSKPSKLTKEKLAQETKKLSQELLKSRQNFLKAKEARRDVGRQERAQKIEEQKEQLKAERKIKKETVPYYNNLKKMAEATEVESDMLKRLLTISETGNLSSKRRIALVNRLKKGVKLTFPIKTHLALDLTRSLTADTQEMQKLATSFMKNVKEILGTSRITQNEILMYLKSVPNEMMSPEGRRKVISQKLILNKMDKLRKEAADSVIKQYGGLGKINILKLEREVEKRVKAKEAKLMRKFIDAIPTKFTRKMVEKGKRVRKKRGKVVPETILFG